MRKAIGGNVNVNSVEPIENLAISTIIYNSTSFDMEYLVNNQQAGTNNITTPTQPNVLFRVSGLDTGTGADWDGIIAEIVAYNRILDSDEQTEIFNYLNRKWGVV